MFVCSNNKKKLWIVKGAGGSCEVGGEKEENDATTVYNSLKSNK